MSEPDNTLATAAQTASEMDKINTTILKTAIEAIPLLTNDNYTLWKNRVENVLDLQDLRTALTSSTGVLSSTEDIQLRTIITSKLESSIHANVITHDNEKSAKKIWKSISEYFASSQASNRARVFNAVLHVQFNPNDVQDFITQVKTSISRLHEVGIDLPKDIIAYLILHKLPASMTNISQQITHSDKPITAELVLDHLRLYANDQQSLANSGTFSKTASVSLLTDESKKCKKGWHNPRATGHTLPNCWFLYPHLRPDSEKGRKGEASVSSFHSSLTKLSANFILDSGSSSHMISDEDLFISIDHSEQGLVRTSSGEESLEIKGIGTIKLSHENGNLFLHNVLFVPNLVVNLLSVRCLVLDDFNVQFLKNSFSISRNNNLIISGRYEGNLPCLTFSNLKEKSFLSAAEALHKSMGHVSYHRLRQKLGIHLKNFGKCEACALGKITKASFKTKHQRAKRPFEELHLDLIGPISPSSREGDRFILTVVDSNTRYCSAIPISQKSDVYNTLATTLDFEAKRFGYYPTILTDSKLSRRHWSDLVKVSTLTLNQIPSHRSAKSPYEQFRGRTIPLDFFHPIGNPVSFLNEPKKPGSKLYPKGSKGRLIGYNEELLSYRILSDDGRLIDTKSVQFLDFDLEEKSYLLDDEEEFEIIQERTQPQSQIENEKESVELDERENIEIKEETEEEEEVNTMPAEDTGYISDDSEEEISELLVPTASTRVLRERTSKDGDSFVFFHVDDLIVAGKVDVFEDLFLLRFPNSSAHDPDTLLGMELNQDANSVTLSQPKLIKKGLELLGMEDCKPVLTPLSPGIKLLAPTEEEKKEFNRLNINYRSHTGLLNFLSCRTRPDLAPAVSMLSSFNSNPGIKHWQQILHCWKYLKGTIDMKLTLRPDLSDNNNNIKYFTDATWADDLESRLSRSGTICFWKSCPIAWNSKKQKNIALSSTEAELNALSDGVQESQWITYLIEELWKEKLKPSEFNVDNQGLIEKIKNFGSNSKTKHLDIKMKWLRELKNSNQINVKLIPSEEMVADALTKASNADSLKRLQHRCFLVLVSPS
ncbi:hypothetical protein VP01_2957g1 [Puccinia sorghi]|uniref:Integrase catalytic domain-containing protein n=1 Tax=Puccinia sorghi TaxID=27349 RepID=A0A0L6V0U4_9BASI|nr:hypothetical protein VP01_2957g1 [Puccinia sorghi]